VGRQSSYLLSPYFPGAIQGANQVRWFKLLSSWYSDDWLQAIKADFGPSGWLWYVLSISLVAESMDGSARSSRSLSWSEFRALLGVSHSIPILRFMAACQGHVSFSVGLTSGNLVEVDAESLPSLIEVVSKSGPSRLRVVVISCPKLLKYRDEWSKRSGVAHEQDTEVDPEIDLKTTPLIPSDPVKAVWDAWQSASGLIKSRRLDGQVGHIKAAIEYLGNSEKVVLCVQRYSHILVNAEGKYRQAYRWGIGDFLCRRSHYNLDRLSSDDWEREFLAWSTGRKFPTVEQLTEGLRDE
jgi:hypothetical protein